MLEPFKAVIITLSIELFVNTIMRLWRNCNLNSEVVYYIVFIQNAICDQLVDCRC